MDVYLNLSNYDRVLLGQIDHDAIDEVTVGFPGVASDLLGFFQVLGIPFPNPLPPEYANLCRQINAQGRTSLMVVPQEKMTTHLQSCFRVIQKVLCDKENADYLVTYLTIKRFLQKLTRASVNISRLRSLIGDCQHGTVGSSLESFLPLEDGKTRLIEYSTDSTATGRLTVKKGPQILTIPSDARACIQSSFPAGQVLQIDIISAEPKFALYLRGIDPPKDVYSHIAGTILEGQVTREQAKFITLCALYGQSVKKLEEQLPPTVGARGVIQRTKTYFDRDFLLSRLKIESKQGVLRNAIGRPLNIPDDNPHLLVSYYLQSSVAEGSILMFSRFIEETKLRCCPLFVIHDALIVDCDRESSKKLLQSSNMKLSLGDWVFEVEVKNVGDI